MSEENSTEQVTEREENEVNKDKETIDEKEESNKMDQNENKNISENETSCTTVCIASPKSVISRSSHMSLVRSDDDIFKMPIAKKKRKVLEEDQYVVELEKIIERDFFPDLEKLKAQNAYWNAVENNDIHMLRELYSKYTFGKKTPIAMRNKSLDTPSTFETPIELQRKNATPLETPESTPTHLPMETPDLLSDNVSESGKSSKSDKSNKAQNLSLNTYLDKYTSEDNQSFQDIMDESERKHKIKYAWLYDAEKLHSENSKTALALPSIEQQALEYNRPFNIDTWTYKNKNYVMYCPEGVPFTPEEEIQRAKNKAEVLYNNTRFAKNPYKDQDNAPSSEVSTPSSSQSSVIPNQKSALFKGIGGKIGVDGKEITEGNTPKVNGFSLVRTPSPTPCVEDSPFMTWGEIEGTPFRLDGGDTPLPTSGESTKPFRILEQSKRERIALELADKVSLRYRDKKQKAIDAARSHLSTPSPKPMSSLDRLSTMSPAARKFFTKSGLSTKVGSDNALRKSYTPSRSSVLTPGRAPFTPSSTPGSTRSNSSNISRTPKRIPAVISTSSSSSSALSSNLTTDGLLKLPVSNKNSNKSSSSSRKTAADFF